MDGIVSLLAGLVLTVASVLPARESRSLPMGEGISATTEQQIIPLIEKTSPKQN